MKLKIAWNELLKSDFIYEMKDMVSNNRIIFGIGFILLLYIINQSIWTTLDGLITTGTLLVVLVNIYLEAKDKENQMQKIKIYFYIEELNQKYLLDLDIARKEITRAEIQGVLSAFQTIPSQRYSIDYLSNIQFLDDIYKIQNNELDELVIKLTKKEFQGYIKKENDKSIEHNGFDKKKMKKIEG